MIIYQKDSQSFDQDSDRLISSTIINFMIKINKISLFFIFAKRYNNLKYLKNKKAKIVNNSKYINILVVKNHVALVSS